MHTYNAYFLENEFASKLMCPSRAPMICLEIEVTSNRICPSKASMICPRTTTSFCGDTHLSPCLPCSKSFDIWNRCGIHKWHHSHLPWACNTAIAVCPKVPCAPLSELEQCELLEHHLKMLEHHLKMLHHNLKMQGHHWKLQCEMLEHLNLQQHLTQPGHLKM